MSAIEDVLAKPVWPKIEKNVEELLLNKLGPLCSRGSSDDFKVGFNESMRSIEQQKAKVLFVCRYDLHAAECMPLALASSAQHITLVALPKGSKQKLGTEVAALCSSNDLSLLRAVEGIGYAKLDWVFRGSKLIAKKKKNKAVKAK